MSRIPPELSSVRDIKVNFTETWTFSVALNVELDRLLLLHFEARTKPAVDDASDLFAAITEELKGMFADTEEGSFIVGLALRDRTLKLYSIK